MNGDFAGENGPITFAERANDTIKSMTKCFVDRLCCRRTRRILILGLECAGKTTLLYRLKLGETISTISTVGFNVETSTHHGMPFRAWDLGGGKGWRPLWRYYFEAIDAAIFVVVCADASRMNEAATELARLFSDEEQLKHAKLLIMANKQDLFNAIDVETLRDCLKIETIGLSEADIHIQPTSFFNGDGVNEGLDW